MSIIFRTFAQVFHFDVAALVPGITHIAQAVYITVLFSLAMIFPNQFGNFVRAVLIHE